MAVLEKLTSQHDHSLLRHLHLLRYTCVGHLQILSLLSLPFLFGELSQVLHVDQSAYLVVEMHIKLANVDSAHLLIVIFVRFIRIWVALHVEGRLLLLQIIAFA